MKLSFSIIALILGLISSSAATGLSESIRSAVDQFVTRAELDQETPGIAILVSNSRNGKIVYQRYVGMADLKAKTSIGPDTPFRLGSVSKPITAAAIQHCQEHGILQIQDFAQRILPTLSHEGLTIHHLLTHSAGLQEYTGFQFLRSKSTNAEIVKYLEGKRLLFEPGSERRYSNSGYAMLASSIEAASGMSFAAYLQQHFFAPLAMDNTSVPGLGWKSVPGRAVGYNRILWQYLEDDEDFLNGIVGDKGVYSSVSDLDKWMTAYFGHQLVSRESVEQALQPQAIDAEPFRYGYGWTIERIAGQKLAWHNGCWVGFDTFVGRVVPRETNILLLSNAGLDTRDHDVTKLGFAVAARIAAQRSRPK